VAGRKEILELLAPVGPAYQAGTMAGNPVALAAGIATLDVLRDESAYMHLDGLGKRLETRLADRRRDGKTKTRLARVGSVFWPYLDDAGDIPTTAEGITDKAIAAFRAAYRGWLERGVYLPPSAYEVGFLSVTHKEADVDALADML
jgi:glutamate-1-semialdehyde 2,1-aminomutase